MFVRMDKKNYTYIIFAKFKSIDFNRSHAQ